MSELSAPSDVDIGDTYTITIPKHVSLISDRGNLSHKTDLVLPSGFEILRAYFNVIKKKHTVTYTLEYTQPNTVRIDKDVLIDLRSAIDEVAASAEYKKAKISGAASLKVAASTLALRQTIDATNRGVVKVRAWADGRKYSSKDGVIIADVVIEMLRRPTEEDIADLILKVIGEIDANTTESFKAARGKIEDFNNKSKKSKDISDGTEKKDDDNKPVSKDASGASNKPAGEATVIPPDKSQTIYPLFKMATETFSLNIISREVLIFIVKNS